MFIDLAHRPLHNTLGVEDMSALSLPYLIKWVKFIHTDDTCALQPLILFYTRELLLGCKQLDPLHLKLSLLFSLLSQSSLNVCSYIIFNSYTQVSINIQWTSSDSIWRLRFLKSVVGNLSLMQFHDLLTPTMYDSFSDEKHCAYDNRTY